MDNLNNLIADLEARLHLSPGEIILLPSSKKSEPRSQSKNPKPKSQSKNPKFKNPKAKNPKSKKSPPPADQPEICKLEFKVGVITKVWNHPDADKLYCEEIDCGEEAPRLIASGLRPHYSLEEMLGQRLLVVANLKPRNLVGFKSFGMVLCASTENNVEFIEPPPDAVVGEPVKFEGLPDPIPVSSAQVDKKKVFVKAMDGMRTNASCLATWEDHVFMTSAGPCRSKSLASAPMR